MQLLPGFCGLSADATLSGHTLAKVSRDFHERIGSDQDLISTVVVALSRMAGSVGW